MEELWASGVRHAAKLLRAAASYFDGELDEAALAKEIGDQAMDTGREKPAIARLGRAWKEGGGKHGKKRKGAVAFLRGHG